MIYPINRSETLATAYLLHKGLTPVRKARGCDFGLLDGTLIEVKSAKQLFTRSQFREIATNFRGDRAFVLLLTTSDTVMSFTLTDVAKRDGWPFDRRRILDESKLSGSPWSTWDVGDLTDEPAKWSTPAADEILRGLQ